MKIKNVFTVKQTQGEINDLPSKTIPEQTMSIPELIRRYASGMPLGGQRTPIWDKDEVDLLNGVNWEKLDLSEKAEYMENFKYEIQEIQKRMESATENTEEKPNPNVPDEL